MIEPKHLEFLSKAQTSCMWILASLSFYACHFNFWGTDYAYTVTAAYSAPKTKIKAFVFTTGNVPKNSTLSNPRHSTIDVRLIFEDHIGDSLHLTSLGDSVLSVKRGNESQVIDRSIAFGETIYRLAQQITNDHADSLEIVKLTGFIQSTASGPKGTYFGDDSDIVVDTLSISSHAR